jgi:hypothetical protein
MAASGIGNPSGLVIAADGGVPRTLTAKARENISGGVFVFASGADNVVTNTNDSFAFGDIEVAGDASGAQFNGIAQQYAASGTAVSVVVNGLVNCVANGTVTAGFPVQCDGNNAVANLGSATIAAGTFGKAIGRAWTSAASGGNCQVYLGGF